jgi:hypothetical protein
MIAATPQSALDQVLDSVWDCLTAEVAQRIVDVELPPAVKSRIDELAIKANRGTLTSTERKQYEEFVEAIDLLAIFQAKARLVLSRQLD